MSPCDYKVSNIRTVGDKRIVTMRIYEGDYIDKEVEQQFPEAPWSVIR